ncbi:hypothetical protein SK128_021493, partial [Halocaridina rubra]
CLAEKLKVLKEGHCRTQALPRSSLGIAYVIRDKGDYILIVKWGDDNIPGSPFHVTV